MNTYEIMQIWVGPATVELTSTNEAALKDAINYSVSELDLPTQKFDLKQNTTTKTLTNVVVQQLDGPLENFMYFWAILGYFVHSGWEPIATTNDTFTLKKTNSEKI